MAESDTSVRPKDIVSGRYEIEHEIGRGGMATVYLARDLLHQSRVAVKVLSKELAPFLGGERFVREIRITAGLQHPNILPIFDSGIIHGLPYYVMPYVDGMTLAQRLAKEGQLPLPDALDITFEIADALACAHAAGFVHRDIKPANILLPGFAATGRRSGGGFHAVLADFGIARAVADSAGGDRITASGVTLGTAQYMSPEQAASDRLDGRSDIYSLGCVLYEMLAGQPPFSGGSAQSIIARHLSDPVPSLHTVRTTLGPRVEEVIVKAMAKSPADRYADADAFREAIGHLSAAERSGTLRGPTGIGARAKPGKRASRSLIATVAAVAAVALSALVWQVSRSGLRQLDANRVMVYPLVVPASFTGPRSTGEDVATMIGSALDGAGPLRWIDGWRHLDAATRDDIRTLTTAEARALARSEGCAFYLTGRLVGRGDSTEVALELNDVSGDSVVARGKAIGPTSETWRLGLRAVNAVLPSLIPGTSNVVATWDDRDPGAIASFLLGESAFRRIHFSEALTHFRDAVKADSTFGVAAIRGAQAAAGDHRSSEAQSLIGVALRQKMPARYLEFARGYEAYLAGSADSAVAALRRALALDPGMSWAWMQLGEVYIHLLPEAGNTDLLARAAFDSALAIDPSAQNPLFHSLEIRLRSGDMKETPRMLRDFLAAKPDTLLAAQIGLMDECVRKPSATANWRRVADSHPFVLLTAANALKGGGARTSCAAAALEALAERDTAAGEAADTSRRWNSLIGLQSVLLATGRASEAAAKIDQSIASGAGGSSLFLQDAPYYPELRARATATARADEVTFGPNYEKCPHPLRLWQLGVFEARLGRNDVAQIIARHITTIADSTGVARYSMLARSVTAHATLAAGDTTRAIALFRALVQEEIPGPDLIWNLAASRGPDRLALAELLVARGDFQKAIEVANVFDSAWPLIYILYYPASLEVRAKAAVGLKDANLAASYRKRLAALRERPRLAAM